MKLLLVVVGLVLAASAEESLFWDDYHVEYGIPEAARIKLMEESTDFDGARIVGGQFSSLGQHPHFAGLIVTLTNNRQSVCGSSILTHSRLLSAAHCWTHGASQGRSLTVVAGSIRLFHGGQRLNTNNIQLHANYNQNNLNNDIAVISIGRLNFNNHVNRINIASGNNQFVGATAVASGFGRQGDNIDINNNQALKHVSMPVITNAACASVYGNQAIIASVLCTATTGGRGTCQGDSGGPLVVGTQLVGVTSFVHRSGCQRGQPAGFARVTSFHSWISQRI